MIDAGTKRYIDQQIDTLRREMRASGIGGGSSNSSPKTVAYAVSAGHASTAGSAGTASVAISASTAGYVELTAGSENVHIINGTTISVDSSGPEPLEDYTVTQAIGNTNGTLFYGLSQQGDNTVSVDSSLDGTPLDFEGASVL